MATCCHRLKNQRAFFLILFLYLAGKLPSFVPDNGMGKAPTRLDTLQTLELAEGVEIRLRIAGPFLRFVAFGIDMLVQWGVLMVADLLSSLMGLFIGLNVADGVMMLIYFFTSWFYFVFMEAGKGGATLGKKAMGLRVVQATGARLTIGQAMIRNFIRFIDLWFPLLPLVPFLNKKFQRLGDMAAGTLVVYAKPLVEPVMTGPPALVSVPVTRPLLREEIAAILSFRDRSGNWSEPRRVEMAAHLGPLTREDGIRNVSTVMGMARWLEGHK